MRRHWKIVFTMPSGSTITRLAKTQEINVYRANNNLCERILSDALSQQCDHFETMFICDHEFERIADELFEFKTILNRIGVPA